MSDTNIETGRDAKTGRFQPGNKPLGHRPLGSKNRLAESFVADLADAWQRHGITALDRCAVEEPAQFLRVVAQLMPKDINLNVAVDVTAFADRFKAAAELLGQEVHQIRPRRSLRVIEHKQKEVADAG